MKIPLLNTVGGFYLHSSSVSVFDQRLIQDDDFGTIVVALDKVDIGYQDADLPAVETYRVLIVIDEIIVFKIVSQNNNIFHVLLVYHLT